MSTGHGNGLPDYTGGYESGQNGYGDGGREQSGRGIESVSRGDTGYEDPYADGTSGADPYAASMQGADPYAAGMQGADPYGQEQLVADGFAPTFSSDGGGHGRAVGSSAGPSPWGQQYGPAGYGAYASPAPTSSMAVTGFVLGLVGLFFCPGIVSPLGLLFSALGMKETGAAAMPPKGGRGLAIAGLVTSLIGVLLLLLGLAYFVFMLVVVAGSEGAGY